MLSAVVERSGFYLYLACWGNDGVVHVSAHIAASGLFSVAGKVFQNCGAPLLQPEDKSCRLVVGQPLYCYGYRQRLAVCHLFMESARCKVTYIEIEPFYNFGHESRGTEGYDFIVYIGARLKKPQI